MKIFEIIESGEPAGNLAGEIFDPRNPQTFPQPRGVRVPRNDRVPRNPALSPTSGVILRKDPMIQAPLDPMFESRIAWGLPPVPGTAPIPDGHVRLFHQTNPESLASIKRHGISLSRARGIEGPRAIYADEKGFYGKPGDVPTVEFHVPAEQWDRPFVRSDLVPPQNIIGIHRSWHSTARYIEEDPNLIQKILAGEHDDLLSDPNYGKAIRYIKHKYNAQRAGITEAKLPPVQDQTFNKLLARGHHVSHSIYDPKRQSHRVFVAPTGGVPYTSRKSWIPEQPGRISYYDPSLAKLITRHPNEQYLEFTHAQLHDHLSDEIPPLGPGFIYRGASQEEFDNFRQTGMIASNGSHNMGDDQVGLTYWSTKPEQAASYANSFAPNGMRATFQHPAYVFVARAPDPSETRRVQGTAESEVGVRRPIQAAEIVQVWRGRVYDYDSGDMTLVPHDRIAGTYKVGGSSMPTGRVMWEQIK